jgi:hypothetical protein
MNPSGDGRDIALRAERLEDHVAKHVRLGFSFADLANVDELLHERLVLGCEADVIFPNYVTTAIADLHEIEVVSSDRSAGERRAHTGATRIFLALEMNREVRVDRGVLQTLNQIKLRITRLFAFGSKQHLAHGIDRHSARYVAGECSTHAIRNDEHESTLAQGKTREFFRRSGSVRAGPGLFGRQIEN